MRSQFRSVAMLATGLFMAGCASLPRERGYIETRALIEAQRPLAADWSPLRADPDPDVSSRPISADDAVRLALAHNPRIRALYARLGIGRAELEDARRLANPTLGYARMKSGDGGAKITRRASLSLTDLLLLPTRTRMAEGELDRQQLAVASDVLALATEAEIAWYTAAGAQQIAAMRDLVAQAAQRSADLAERFFAAGNIHRLQLEQERAAATRARIDALMASAQALRARSALGGLLGLPSAATWSLEARLPAPRAVAYAADALIPLALESRLDLKALQQAVVTREDALGVTRRWRWLGSIEFEYEREREADGGRMRGPALALGLPLFDQGQGALERAKAELLQARAELDAKVHSIHDAARVGVEQLSLAAMIADRYRAELLPAHEAIVARTEERVNYMLVGVFELLAAKQQEYEAYQAYLEAVRDYWIARAELRGAVGGRLPDDDQPLIPTLGVEAILPVESEDQGHHHHHHSPKDKGDTP